MRSHKSSRVWKTSALVGILSAMVLLAVITGPAAATIESTDRTISDASVAPGETVEVTVNAELTSESDDIRVNEVFSPAFADVEIVDDDGAFISEVTDDGTEIVANWGDGTDEVTLIYEVTVPESAEPGEEFDISGELEDAESDTSMEIDGPDTTITVAEGTFFDVEITETNTPVSPGEDIEVSVKVTNTGSSAGTQTINITAHAIGTVSDTVALNPGETTTLTPTFETTAETTGTIDIEAVTDDDTDTASVFVSDVNAERSIDESMVAAGDTTTVELTIALDATSDDLRISELFNPPFAAVEILDDDGATITQVTNTNDELVGSWGSVDTITLIYDVTIPEDAADEAEFAFAADVEDRDNGVDIPVAGDDAITVGESVDPIAEYADDDGTIGTAGLLDAAADFRNDELDSGLLLDVATAFRSGEAVV